MHFGAVLSPLLDVGKEPDRLREGARQRGAATLPHTALAKRVQPGCICFTMRGLINDRFQWPEAHAEAASPNQTAQVPCPPTCLGFRHLPNSSIMAA